MFRSTLGLFLVAGSMFAAAQASAQETCTRGTLQAAVASYIAAQTTGDPMLIALAFPYHYVENRVDADITAGVLATAQTIDLDRSLLDTESCETFTEVIITDPAHPYVIGTHLKVEGGKVSLIDSLVTDEGDWLFNAANTLKYSSAENWDTIPEAARSEHATLLAAANAYFDLFNDKTVEVPWGAPCARLEGGLYTGKGEPDDTCNIGVPDGIQIVDRHFVVDDTIGSVVGLVTFGDNGLPDSHLFRVENGKIRYIHTITVCFEPNCGFPPLDQMAPPPQ